VFFSEHICSTVVDGMHTEQSDGEDNASDTSESSKTHVLNTSSQHTASIVTASPPATVSSSSRSLHLASKSISSNGVDGILRTLGDTGSELLSSSSLAALSMYSDQCKASESVSKKRWRARVRTTRCQKCVSCLAPDCGKCYSCRLVNCTPYDFDFRATTCLVNREMSGNFTADSEMSGILVKNLGNVREL